MGICVLIDTTPSIMRKNLIMDLSFKFSLKMLKLYKQLAKENEYIISKQLLRSSTSIGANVFEASAAASRKDFANKMTIASKEARETYYWLKLLDEGNVVSLSVSEYIIDIIEIIRILTAIVKTAKSNLK